MNNTTATLILRERLILAIGRHVDLVIWQLPSPVRGSQHHYKYRLAYVVNDVCVLRYDNEAGKGDHRHWQQVETPYHFSSIGQLREDFLHDIKQWNSQHRDL